MGRLNDEDIKFLSSLNIFGSSTGRRLLPLATRKQDRARTRAKKNGWAYFDRSTWAWRLTDSGRAALREATPEQGEQE